jgi:hypothetical protein
VAETTAREVPRARQLAHAEAAVNHANARRADARSAVRSTRAAYTLARAAAPAAQTTDQARERWEAARTAEVRALVDLERARDELRALQTESGAPQSLQEAR